MLATVPCAVPSQSTFEMRIPYPYDGAYPKFAFNRPSDPYLAFFRAQAATVS
jgi:hypothetical protein